MASWQGERTTPKFSLCHLVTLETCHDPAAALMQAAACVRFFLFRWWLMKEVQRVAIVDPSDATREPLRNLLLGIETVWLEAECSRYDFFVDVARQSAPDLAVIALDSDQNKAIQLIAQLTQEFPGMPVLAVSARGDGQSILQALRNGAKEFL